MLTGYTIKRKKGDDPRLKHDILELLDDRMKLYRTGFTNKGEIIDTHSKMLMKEAHLKSVLRRDYLNYCEENNKTPDMVGFKYCLNEVLKMCYKAAAKLKDDTTQLDEPFIVTNLEFHNKYVDQE
jgi:hypothetical protein